MKTTIIILGITLIILMIMNLFLYLNNRHLKQKVNKSISKFETILINVLINQYLYDMNITNEQDVKDFIQSCLGKAKEIYGKQTNSRSNEN